MHAHPWLQPWGARAQTSTCTLRARTRARAPPRSHAQPASTVRAYAQPPLAHTRVRAHTPPHSPPLSPGGPHACTGRGTRGHAGDTGTGREIGGRGGCACRVSVCAHVCPCTAAARVYAQPQCVREHVSARACVAPVRAPVCMRAAVARMHVRVCASVHGHRACARVCPCTAAVPAHACVPTQGCRACTCPVTARVHLRARARLQNMGTCVCMRVHARSPCACPYVYVCGTCKHPCAPASPPPPQDPSPWAGDPGHLGPRGVGGHTR